MAAVHSEAVVALFISRFVLFIKHERKFCDRNKFVWEELGAHAARNGRYSRS